VNDVQSQLIAVCPECSASSTVSFDKLGQQIACPQCRCTFVAGEASLPDNQRSGERPVLPSKEANGPVDRIDAICTNCNATLRVRRAYIGNDVRCKYCDQIFRVWAPAETQATVEPDPPDPRHKALQDDHEQLYVAHNLLQSDHDRLKTETSELREKLRSVTTELEAIRGALGTIAPEEVGSLANDRHSLLAEVHRLRDEIHASLAAQSEHDQLVGEQQRLVSELDSAHTERDLLAKQLTERAHQIDVDRAEHERLIIEKQTFLDEIDQLRLALAQSRDEQHDHLLPERVVSGEIGAQGEPLGTAIVDSGAPRATTAAELEALRAQVAELSVRLDESEQRHREMADVLEGIGIQCRTNRA
jgi:DNA-directed RNA polymerase subunit M/transcription elongation factor TFIIS